VSDTFRSKLSFKNDPNIGTVELPDCVDLSDVEGFKEVLLSGRLKEEQIKLGIVRLLEFVCVKGVDNIWPYMCSVLTVDNWPEIVRAASACGNEETLKVASAFFTENIALFSPETVKEVIVRFASA
jgi:hypothetical protein